MSFEDWKARFNDEVCTCGHARGDHPHGECSVDHVGHGRVLPCLCLRFVQGARA